MLGAFSVVWAGQQLPCRSSILPTALPTTQKGSFPVNPSRQISRANSYFQDMTARWHSLELSHTVATITAFPSQPQRKEVRVGVRKRIFLELSASALEVMISIPAMSILTNTIPAVYISSNFCSLLTSKLLLILTPCYTLKSFKLSWSNHLHGF